MGRMMTDAKSSIRQDVIRQWARKRNLAIGSRGRLPQSIVEAFQRGKAASAGSDERPEDAAQPTDSGFGPLEPLARYLEPRFGNIYDWDNTVVPYIDVDGFDVQPWTDELRQVVKHYLLREAPVRLLNAAFPHRQEARPADWADEELEGYQPWEVGLRFHEAAITLLPTLDALIGHLQTWPYEDDREDAFDWLEQHATESQLKQIAIATRQTDLTERPYYANLAFDLAHRLEPPTLLKVWHVVTDPAPSDLTDTEWELLKPFIPAGSGRMRYGTRYIRYGTRAALNGILYRFQEGCPWSRVPIRYGTETVVYQRRYLYKRKGVFARMLEGLEDNPEAARVVDWLRHEVGAVPTHAENGTLDT
jgi:transposase